MSNMAEIEKTSFTLNKNEQMSKDIRHRSLLRKKLFLLLFIGIVAICSGIYEYDVLIVSRHVETDNAYVGANIAEITPLIGGPVQDVLVEDTQFVKRGDVLVRLDDTDARLVLNHAEAELLVTIRRVRGLIATDGALNAQITAKAADEARASAQLAAAKADLNKAQIDLDRRQALSLSGSVSGDELTAAQNSFHTATANLQAAEAAFAFAQANRSSAVGTHQANNVLIQDTTIDNNPEVQAARTARDQAQVDLNRTVIRAPVDGVVSRRDVQIGQRVQPGTVLMAVVPIENAYVDANFKEVQLSHVKPGQPVTLTSDLYGSDVKFHGRVVGFSGGTGAAFAIVPAQNATGNWIKVVQRLPVRIALNADELREHPLRVGLSMDADIRVMD